MQTLSQEMGSLIQVLQFTIFFSQILIGHTLTISATTSGQQCMSDCAPHSNYHFCWTGWRRWDYCIPGTQPALQFYTARSRGNYAAKCTSHCGPYGWSSDWCFTDAEGGWDRCSQLVNTTTNGKDCVSPCAATDNGNEYRCNTHHWYQPEVCAPGPLNITLVHETLSSAVNVGQLIHLLSLTHIPNYHLQSMGERFHLDLNVQTKRIELKSKCSLSLSSFGRLSPEVLGLEGVSFTRNGHELREVTVNEFLDLPKIKLLRLICWNFRKKNMRIDMSEDISMQYVYLANVTVLNWKEASWNVQELILGNIPFVQKTKMKVQEMNFRDSSVDISCLPQTLQQLTLNGDETEVFVRGRIDLPHLNYLKISNRMNSSSLAHFSTVQLTHIDFYGIEELNMDDLPRSVTQIKVNKHFDCGTKIVGGRRKLDKLFLHGFSFEDVEQSFSHFKADNLIFYYYNGISPKQLLELMNKEIKTMAVGRIHWGHAKDTETLSRYVDKKADYYLVEDGRGRGIEREEFMELFKFY